MAKQLVLSRSSNEPIYSISCSESEEWSAINLHPQLPKRIVVKCSGDGLVCFWDSSYVIWNPSTDRYQSIPLNDSTNIPCICPSRECFREASGFVDGIGFVPESHDYKLVTFISCHYCDDDSDDDEDDLFEHHGSDHVAVYLSKTNSWKELPFPFHFEDISPVYFATPTCVNGFIYWITQRNVILSFDLSSDKFSTILCPDDIPPDFRWTYSIYDIPPGFCHKEKAHLLDFDGSLCFVIRFQSEEKATTKTLSFWVYAASSSSPSPWTRKINLDVRLDTALADIPLWLGKKNINGGEFLMLQGVDGSVLEYDYTTRELKRIDLISTYPKQCFVPNNVMVSSYVATSANIAKTKHVNANIVDRISQLPDDLILCILSFLSLKEAASTSVLSTRWSALWKHTPNLNFHVTNVNNKYIKWVNSVVESHKALSLKEFSISFPNYEPTSSTIMKWLEFAFSRRVEVLELNFCGRTFGFLQEFLQKSTMTNLKSLCLKCLKVSGSDIGLFLRNCPLLERLIIKSAVLTSDLEVCSSALKHLDIQHCEGGKSIKGYAPNLTSLKIDSAPFSLHKADDHLNLAWESPLFPFISPLLTTLEFTLHFPPKGFGNRFPLMTTLKELILTYLGGLYIRLITSLLCAFPYLEEFEIKCFRRVQKHARSPVEGQGMDVVRFCHCHLRVFKFTWFDVGDAEHIKLMSCILDNCVGLQKIILDIYDVDSLTYVAAGEYAKQLQSKLPTHIQLIISFNNRHLV